MTSSQKADIGYKSNSPSNSTSKNSKPATHKKVNNAIHKTEAKKIPVKYNKNISMDPMPESLLKSKIFFKMFYSFLFVHELNKTEVIVASYIYTFYEHTKAVFAKSSTLGKYLNIDKGQISRILNHLVELEVVKKETQGKNTLYTPLLDPDDLTQFACELGSKVFTNEDEDEMYIEEDKNEDEGKDEDKKAKDVKSTSQPKPTSSTPSPQPQPPAPTSTPTSSPTSKPKLPPLPPEIQAQLASDNFDMIYYDTPPYYNPSKIDELNLRPSSLRSGIYTYPKPGDPNFNVSDRTSPYYDPEDDPDNDAYWDWSDDIPVPKKKARQVQQTLTQSLAQTQQAQTKASQAKTDTIKPAASATNNTAYWR